MLLESVVLHFTMMQWAYTHEDPAQFIVSDVTIVQLKMQYSDWISLKLKLELSYSLCLFVNSQRCVFLSVCRLTYKQENWNVTVSRNFNFQFIQTDMLYRNGWGVKFGLICICIHSYTYVHLDKSNKGTITIDYNSYITAQPTICCYPPNSILQLDNTK